MARITLILIAACTIIAVVLCLRGLGRRQYIDLHTNITLTSAKLDHELSIHDRILNWMRERSRQGSGHAFIASFMVIIVSELCDKTFFIAAILSMKSRRLIVYTGAMTALALMTVISALLGNVVTAFIPPKFTHHASTLLFGLFGIKMLFEGMKMNGNNDCTEEFEEAKIQIASNDRTPSLMVPAKLSDAYEVDLEKGESRTNWVAHSHLGAYVRIPDWMCVTCQAFVMTFLAEWGDRSQVTTIMLAAKESTEVPCVIAGSCLGHAFCTGLAVIAGKALASRISIRTITLLGAFVFIAFTVSSLFFIPVMDVV